MVKEINFFGYKGEYGFLSNFFPCPQLIGGITYPTNENFYASMKAKDVAVEKWIASAPSPFLAMKAGQSLRPKREFRDDWTTEERLRIILVGLRAKFAYKNQLMREQLLATGNAILHEASPHDKFWGKKGYDWLGILLMRVRDEIRDGKL